MLPLETYWWMIRLDVTVHSTVQRLLHKSVSVVLPGSVFLVSSSGDPVVLIKRNKNFSSLPEGDIDARRNRERMTVTTNRIFFPEVAKQTSYYVYIYCIFNSYHCDVKLH